MTRLLELGAIPIINENDTVATDEILMTGENDTLSAIVAAGMKADLLIILSDIDGLFDSDPRVNAGAKLIKEVRELTPEIVSLAGGKGSDLGTGGMSTKLKAARVAMDAGVDMVIANSSDPMILYDILDGAPIGTRFYGKQLSR